jgi:4-amino-4-deoxy-L-arabinose transferase-like glycosyltransferase
MIAAFVVFTPAWFVRGSWSGCVKVATQMRPLVIVILGCCLFAALGLALIPYAGVEDDEALLTAPLYQPIPREFRIRVFHHNIPLMIMSYIGALKTVLYWPILGLFAPNAFSLRVPMVLVGVLTILIFYRLAASISDARAALLASLLLATDPTFLLTETFDWGPVALEHLLLVTGSLMIVRRRLALGCFFFGLALWNKATFVWAFAGLVAGVVAADWPDVRRALIGRRTAASAACAFLLGALPFIIYNVRHPNATLQSNAHLSLENLKTKFYVLSHTADGSGLLGFIPAEESAGNPKPPASRLGRAASWMREHFGQHRTSLFPYAILLALLATPVWWRSPSRRAGLFATVFSVVTFMAMAVTRGAGAAIHHTVLLWPMPQLLVGVAAAALRPRWLLPAVGAVLAASNLLVINQYFYQFERYGAYGSFSDALYPLSDSLSHPVDQTIYVIDWGIFDSLQFLHWGSLDLRVSSEPFMTDTPSDAQRREIGTMLADPHGLFVTHVRPLEMFQGVDERLETAAGAAGYEPEFIRIINDSNGRPVFESIRFRHAGDR